MDLDNISQERLIYEFFLFIFLKTLIHLYKDIVYDLPLDHDNGHPRIISKSNNKKLCNEVRSMYYFSIWLTYWIFNYQDNIKKYESKKKTDKSKEHRSLFLPLSKINKIIYDKFFCGKENSSRHNRVIHLINSRYSIDSNISKGSISELLKRYFYKENFKKITSQNLRDILLYPIKTKIALLFDDSFFDDLDSFFDSFKEQLSFPIGFYRKAIINFLSAMLRVFSLHTTKNPFYKSLLGFDDFDIVLYSNSYKGDYVLVIGKYLDLLLSNQKCIKFITSSQRLTITKPNKK